MTYILQNELDKTNQHYFDTEEEVYDWVDTNVGRKNCSSWTMIDPEGGEWEVYL